MRFQFLPYYFKYIGLVLIIIYLCTEFANGFYAGFTGAKFPQEIDLDHSIDRLIEYPSFISAKVFIIIGYFGFLIYALSKDKVFDEYMIQRRLESIYITFFGSLIFILVRTIFDVNWYIQATYLFESQMILFLVVNKIR